MPKPREEYIHIKCSDRAFLAPLRMMGPIVQPLKVKKKTAIKLITNGCTVYEYDPVTKLTVKLTLMNINDKNRFGTDPMPAPAAAPIKPPVVPVSKPGVPVEPKAPVVPEVSAPEEQVVEENVDPVESAAEVDEPRPDEAELDDQSGTPDVNKVDTYKFVIGENGQVDETVINWKDFTKEERRALRSRITAVNAEATASATN